MPATLILQPLSSSGRWQGFHAANASAFVKERDPTQIEAAAAANKLFALVDGNDEIMGTCGVFEYGDGTYRETGGVRILPPINGFGLQVLLMAVATYSEWVYDPPAVPVVAITAQVNTPSRKNIVRAGFVEIEPSLVGEGRLASMGATIDPSKVYFAFPDTGVATARAMIRAVRDAGEVSKGDRSIKIELAVPVVRDGLI